MTADNPTPQPTNTKARFDAEKIEAGYKYLDSLRELMGVGEPVGKSMPRLPFICDDCHVQQHADGICANCGSRRVRPQPTSAPQPAGEGGVQSDLVTDLQRELAFYFGAYHDQMGHNLDAAHCRENECERIKKLLYARATQPATAPSDLIVDLYTLRNAWYAKLNASQSVAVRDFCSDVEKLIRTTPTDIAERARRAMSLLRDKLWPRCMFTDAEVEQLADIIAAECGGGYSNRSS
jgi:hypothetical protein